MDVINKDFYGAFFRILDNSSEVIKYNIVSRDEDYLLLLGLISLRRIKGLK